MISGIFLVLPADEAAVGSGLGWRLGEGGEISIRRLRGLTEGNGGGGGTVRIRWELEGHNKSV